MSFMMLGSFDSSILSVPIVEAAPLFDFSSTTSVENYILSQATTTQKRADYIAKNESGFVYNQRGDLNIVCQNKDSPDYGLPVTARGIWQITRCYHWEVTDAEADDPIWATNWALPLIENKSSCVKEWTECADYFNVVHTAP